MTQERFERERERLWQDAWREWPGKRESAVSFVLDCDSHADESLFRIVAVLKVMVSCTDSEEVMQRAGQLLPEWFVVQFAPRMSEKEEAEWLEEWEHMTDAERVNAVREERWSLEEWVYWFRHDVRVWTWSGARVRDDGRLEVCVETTELPFPTGALHWLFRACGAREVVAEYDV